MNINKDWHFKNKMPSKANSEERLSWHLEHSKNCSCRGMPEKIKLEIKKRNLS